MSQDSVNAPHHPRVILSLMSGTSVDTIDAAVCRVWQEGARLSCEVLEFFEYPMDETLRERIFEVFTNAEGGVALTCSLNFEIAQAFAHAALGVIQQWGGDPAQIDAIASHGQTLYHIAPHMVSSGTDGVFDGKNGWTPSTLQVGAGAVMAALTNLPVISNFRVADMAVGGNGAPLVPFADYHLFSEPGRGVVVHNLGGIGNCTWLPPSGKADEVIAFDTGPANMIIDALVSHFFAGKTYDEDGQIAASGEVLAALLEEWMAIPYITAKPPKSTGRELFGRQFVDEVLAKHGDRSAQDLIATATEFTAQSLAENLRLHVAPLGAIDKLVLAGGGARNGYLVRRIRELWQACGKSRACDGSSAAGQTEVLILDDLHEGITSKSRECVGFALLGYTHLERLPGNLPSVTGARCPVILGDYTPALGLPTP